VKRALALVLLSACTATQNAPADAGIDAPTLGGPPDPLDSDAAIPARVSAVFGTTCAGIGGESSCHANGAAGLHLVLGDGGDLVGVPSTERPSMLRVRPFDPEQSYLYLKVLGDGGIDGSTMPPSSRYDPRYAALMQAWIAAGAPSP